MRRLATGHHYKIAQTLCIFTHMTKVFAIDSQRHFCQGTGLLVWRIARLSNPAHGQSLFALVFVVRFGESVPHKA
jgi:hypothetical protein